jgi:hypothetical protein
MAKLISSLTRDMTSLTSRIYYVLIYSDKSNDALVYFDRVHRHDALNNLEYRQICV